MKSVIVLSSLISTALGFGSAFASPDEPTTSFLRPEASQFMMPHAVDHTAVMVVDSGSSSLPTVTITRSGIWQKEERRLGDTTQTSLANLATGTSWLFDKGVDGRFLSLTISGTQASHRQTVEKTDESDKALGETCQVWRLARQALTEEDCLTSDGLLLWQKVLGYDGYELASAHAISIQRRSVEPELIAPPVGLLDLSSWGDWVDASPALPNDDVMLQFGGDAGTSSPQTNTLHIRRLGSLYASDKHSGGFRSRIYSNATYTIRIDEMSGGDYYQLNVMPSPAKANVPDKLAQPAQSRKVLGETCQVYGIDAVMDYWQSQCRTDDGIVLEEMTGGRGASFAVSAIHLLRGAMTTEDVAPPADVLQVP